MEKCNIDTEYGNYKDFDSYYWADDFFPTKSVRENARNKFNEVVTDILDDLAIDCGLDPSEWDTYDYDTFCEKMDLYY